MLALLVGLLLLAMLLMSLMWISDGTRNFIGKFTGSMLYSLRNVMAPKVTAVYALFIVHKILLAAILTHVYETLRGFVFMHTFCMVLSFFVSW